MKIKLVCWDWMGTLFSHSLSMSSKNKFFDSHLNQSSVRGVKIPFTWFILNSFVKLGVYQVVISNGSRSSILNELNDYNPFDLILTSDNFPPKPAFAMLLHAMDVLSIYNKDEIILIGDSVIDKVLAERFGIKFFHISEDAFASSYFIAAELGII